MWSIHNRLATEALFDPVKEQSHIQDVPAPSTMTASGWEEMLHALQRPHFPSSIDIRR